MNEKTARQEAEEWCNHNWNNANTIWRERVLLDAARHDALAERVEELRIRNNTLAERHDALAIEVSTLQKLVKWVETRINCHVSLHMAGSDDETEQVAEVESAASDRPICCNCREYADQCQCESPADWKDDPPAELAPHETFHVPPTGSTALIKLKERVRELESQLADAKKRAAYFEELHQEVCNGKLEKHLQLRCRGLQRKIRGLKKYAKQSVQAVMNQLMPTELKTWTHEEIASQLAEYRQDAETLREIVKNKIHVVPNGSGFAAHLIGNYEWHYVKSIHEAVAAALEGK